MNEQDILFYICVPVYKVEKYIDACIESVLMQTYQNFELILVDDGSPDRCGEICEQYAKKDKRIHVIHQENNGVLAARQTAIRFIQQKCENKDQGYIVNLDSDDSLKSNTLQVAYEHFVQTNCDLLIFNADRVQNGNILDKFPSYQTFTGTVTDKQELYNIVLNQSEYNCLWRKIGRLSLYEGEDYSKFYHISSGEDLLQSLKIYKKTTKTVFINDVLYNYTLNPMSITETNNKENWTKKFSDYTIAYGETLRFVEAENVLNDEDMHRYLNFCRRMLLRRIRSIASLQTAFDEKVEFFDDVLKNDYCRKLIDGAGAGEVILKFLQFRQFHLVILSCQVGYAMLQLLKQMKSLIGK